MNIYVYPISSALHNDQKINEDTKTFFDSLRAIKNFNFILTNKPEELTNGDLGLILVTTGGSEKLFLDIKDKLKAPIYLLTYGFNNSLAASIEILSYLNLNNIESEILHGSPSYIAKRIEELVRK